MIFFYTVFAVDSTFFLYDLLSVKNLLNTFKVFSLFSWLKRNFGICDIAEPGSLKGVSWRQSAVQNPLTQQQTLSKL